MTTTTRERPAQDHSTPGRPARRRRRAWLVVAALLVVAVAVGGFVLHRSTSSAASSPTSAQNADLADLSSDSFQQGLSTQLATDIAQITAHPDAADHATAVSSACGVVARITRPLPADQDAWVTANCAAPAAAQPASGDADGD